MITKPVSGEEEEEVGSGLSHAEVFIALESAMARYERQC
jgi:hypothetical protein